MDIETAGYGGGKVYDRNDTVNAIRGNGSGRGSAVGKGKHSDGCGGSCGLGDGSGDGYGNGTGSGDERGGGSAYNVNNNDRGYSAHGWESGGHAKSVTAKKSLLSGIGVWRDPQLVRQKADSFERGDRLRTLRGLCESQKTISTSRLLRYIEEMEADDRLHAGHLRELATCVEKAIKETISYRMRGTK